MGARTLHPKHLHHLIPQMIDHLHRNPPIPRLRKRPRNIAMQTLPSLQIDLRLQRGLERALRIIRA